jgi:hypothetical protein
MDEHPFSKLQESKGAAFPSPSKLEERGRTWRKASDDYLIGFVMESWGTDAANQTSAVVEMQRRFMDAVRKEEKAIKWLTVVLVILTVILAILGVAALRR